MKEAIGDVDIDLLVAPAYHLTPETSSYLIEKGEREGYRTWLPLELSRSHGRHFVVERVGGLDMLTPPPFPLESACNIVLKSIFDRLLALLVIILILPPLMVFVWCIHRLYAPGPLFFVQDRVGVHNKMFKIIKFRSMKVTDVDEAKQAACDDERFFKGSGLLRKANLDEFPQFLNVLMGQMSVVGPRPHLSAHESNFQRQFEKYGIRRDVKPGVTGLAQIKGFRGEIVARHDIRNRARHDLLYVKSWSFLLDVRIVIATFFSIFWPHTNAY